MLTFKEQSCDVLKLFVGENIFNIDDYTVVQKSSFNTDSFQIKFGILAESHFASINYNSKNIDELCICTDQLIPGHTEVLLCKLKGEVFNKKTDDFNYKLEVEYLNKVKSNKRLTALNKKIDMFNTYHLSHTFPTNSDASEKAFTKIFITVNKEVLIESIHTYPEEDRYVYITSKISPREAE